MTEHCSQNIARALQCHNSYQDSEAIGRFSHYTCPNLCVPWSDMCQGVSWCDWDDGECGPHLQCPESRLDNNIGRRKMISALAPDHHYCIDDAKNNNGEYDVIDRSDETNFGAGVSKTEVHIKDNEIIKRFSYCSSPKPPYDPGYMCGLTCMPSFAWCSEGAHYTYLSSGLKQTLCGGSSSPVNTRNSQLCANPLIWDEDTCFKNFHDGRFLVDGIRCRGRNQNCIEPWYTQFNGETSYDTITCSVFVCLCI